MSFSEHECVSCQVHFPSYYVGSAAARVPQLSGHRAETMLLAQAVTAVCGSCHVLTCSSVQVLLVTVV